MIRLLRVVTLAAPLAAVAALTTSSPAYAEQEPLSTPAQARPAGTVDADRSADAAAAKPAKWLALELNPLAATIGRYSVQVEYLPALHHAIVLNPHFDHVNADVTQTIDGQTSRYTEGFSGFGGEVGYRFYTGEKGPNGFYIGPSLLLGAYSASVGSGPSVSFTSIGAALDIGGQAVIGPGIIIGGGFGLQYTSVNKDFNDLPLTASVLAGGGIRPRFLFTVGYAM